MRLTIIVLPRTDNQPTVDLVGSRGFLSLRFSTDLPKAVGGGRQWGGGDTRPVYHVPQEVQNLPVEDLQLG